MHYVYLIQSQTHPNQKYIGCTHNLKKRFQSHNFGQSKHTSKYKPWVLISYHAFADKKKAYAFEQYLKNGSGQAFASKRFW